jgi:hypothetical protein
MKINYKRSHSSFPDFDTILKVDTNISEEHVAFINTLKTEVACSSETLESTCLPGRPQSETPSQWETKKLQEISFGSLWKLEARLFLCRVIVFNMIRVVGKYSDLSLHEGKMNDKE